MERASDFDGVEILALNIFDKRQFQQAITIKSADKRWNFAQASQPGGAPAAFASDDTVTLLLMSR